MATSTAEPTGKALFLKRWLRRPLAMGAVVPSGKLLAEAIAQAALDGFAERPGHVVVELGAGTGHVTRALLDAGLPATALVPVERDPELASFLRRSFADLRVIEGDAAELGQLLAANGIARPAAVVSGLPLLSLPADVVHGIVQSVFEVLPANAPLVQFTYGPTSPVPTKLVRHFGLEASRGARIWRNMLPAVVWTYRRRAAA
jgi:phosphatidylethanolamine/phosphatidyl-N-methylethanolamine N-methyltransferase